MSVKTGLDYNENGLIFAFDTNACATNCDIKTPFYNSITYFYEFNNLFYLFTI